MPAGGKIALQILHAGRYAKVRGRGRAVHHRLADHPHAPRCMSEAEIAARSRTRRDAELAREAGYDGVE